MILIIIGFTFFHEGKLIKRFTISNNNEKNIFMSSLSSIQILFIYVIIIMSQLKLLHVSGFYSEHLIDKNNKNITDILVIGDNLHISQINRHFFCI